MEKSNINLVLYSVKMTRAAFRLFVSKLFFLVFVTKMILSVAPLVVHLDKATVNSIILQLELENETKETTKDSNVKKGVDGNYIYNFESIRLSNTECNLKYYVKPRHYITSFYPSVLTPPPNIA